MTELEKAILARLDITKGKSPDTLATEISRGRKEPAARHDVERALFKLRAHGRVHRVYGNWRLRGVRVSPEREEIMEQVEELMGVCLHLYETIGKLRRSL